MKVTIDRDAKTVELHRKENLDELCVWLRDDLCLDLADWTLIPAVNTVQLEYPSYPTSPLDQIRYTGSPSEFKAPYKVTCTT